MVIRATYLDELGRHDGGRGHSALYDLGVHGVADLRCGQDEHVGESSQALLSTALAVEVQRLPMGSVGDLMTHDCQVLLPHRTRRQGGGEGIAELSSSGLVVPGWCVTCRSLTACSSPVSERSR